MSWGANEKVTIGGVEGDENKSKKVEVQDPKEFRTSLNKSFGMMDEIDEAEQK